MPDPVHVTSAELVRLIRRILPRARSVSVEPASERLVVVYRVRADDTVPYVPGQHTRARRNSASAGAA